MKRLLIISSLLFSLLTTVAVATPHDTRTVSKLFETLKMQPQALRVFLQAMPKGGELHYHWDGSSYPENLLYYARNSDFCYNQQTGAVSINHLCAPSDKLNSITNNPGLYGTIVDKWSLTGKSEDLVETNRHLFQYFIGAEPLVAAYSGEMLAEEMQRAAAQHENYIEPIYLLDLPQMIALGSNIVYNSDFASMQQAVMIAGGQNIVDDISHATTSYYEQAQQILQCNSLQTEKWCAVTVRFQISAMRNMDPQIVFTQLVISFLVAKKNPLVVGVNIVGPENAYYSGRDYDLHMQMIKYLHAQYPSVHLSLHAGELSLPEAPPEFLQDHIAKAIEIAGAERIGHATDILSEKNATDTLQKMARQHIVAEQCLTSNERTLGVVGATQPLPLYMQYHVPVIISTDDEGIFRSTLSQEYWLAVTRYNLSYNDVKTFARNVPTYSFLPGDSLWRDADSFKVVNECKLDKLGSTQPKARCAEFLKHSEKAQHQWKLEKQFKEFEAEILKQALAVV
ncbi:MAG: hypothetical protein EXR81_03345 [Gammaproteobacteria bacterium]|nr:hypothetical protein [Gammaproteobacteria bacterium]